jgi:translation initiation factor eIF-2B subunit epsilon
MGYNAGIDRAREEVVNFLMSKVELEGGAAKVLASAVKVWARWGGLAEGLSPDLSNIALDIQVSRDESDFSAR